MGRTCMSPLFTTFGRFEFLRTLPVIQPAHRQISRSRNYSPVAWIIDKLICSKPGSETRERDFHCRISERTRMLQVEQEKSYGDRKEGDRNLCSRRSQPMYQE